jgi:hypothetical protein
MSASFDPRLRGPADAPHEGHIAASALLSMDMLDRQDVEAIAREIADLLIGRAPVRRYVDTATLAAMLGCSEEWLRDHAAELGAVRLGDGPKGALRFDVASVDEALERRRLDKTKPPRRRTRPGPPRRPPNVRLLPLPDVPRSPR